ncbi:hypothetical protein K523DRAFT_341558 [Schizophyllum commune Tattone D]|nr:hypothetical protein K523DRAFT_341558 [Schizophyllum commune Tattone D]
MSREFSLEECRDLFASAPLDAAYTFQMHEPDKARPRRMMPGQHLDIFPPTMPADWLPPLADEPEGNLLPPVYMFGWLYCRETFRERFPNIKGNARLSFNKVVIKRFYERHRGVTPPDLYARLVRDEYMVYLGSNFLEATRHCAEDRDRVQLIQSFIGETNEPIWYRRTLDELKNIFAAADKVTKASALATKASGQASKSLASQGRKSLKDYPQTYPRHELPPLAKRPSAKDTFAPLYRLGWMYTLREFVERIMKGDPFANRVTTFEKNVQDPFEEKYPKMWLPNFTLCDTSNHVIVYITVNIDEWSRANAQDQKLVDAAKDILGQDEDPRPHNDAPPAPTSHLPPTYSLGWLYQEDEFYERFANEDDGDAWDICGGWKEVVTRPYRARNWWMRRDAPANGIEHALTDLRTPDFDIEDESNESIVYIAYSLKARSRVRPQDQALADAAKDVLEEAREPRWYRRNMWPPMYMLGWSYTPEEFEARLGQGDPMNVFKERIRRPFQAKFQGANVSSPSLDTTSGPCIVSVGSNSSMRSLARAHQENSIETTKALLGETAEPEWIRVPLAEMAGLF